MVADKLWLCYQALIFAAYAGSRKERLNNILHARSFYEYKSICYFLPKRVEWFFRTGKQHPLK